MEIKCRKCDYEWETKSKMFYVSCPRCQSKVKIIQMKGGLQKKDDNENRV